MGYFFNEPTKCSLIGEKSPNLVTLAEFWPNVILPNVVASLVHLGEIAKMNEREDEDDNRVVKRGNLGRQRDRGRVGKRESE